jgi:hypothetical protein
LKFQKKIQVLLAFIYLKKLDCVTAEPEAPLDPDLVDHLQLLKEFAVDQLRFDYDLDGKYAAFSIRLRGEFLFLLLDIFLAYYLVHLGLASNADLPHYMELLKVLLPYNYLVES